MTNSLNMKPQTVKKNCKSPSISFSLLVVHNDLTVNINFTRWLLLARRLFAPSRSDTFPFFLFAHFISHLFWGPTIVGLFPYSFTLPIQFTKSEREILCVYMYEQERERERVCVCMWMCISRRERVCVCVCVCVLFERKSVSVFM